MKPHIHKWKKIGKEKYIPLQGKVRILRVCPCGIFEVERISKLKQ